MKSPFYQDHNDDSLTLITAYYKLDLTHCSPKSHKSKRSTQIYLDFFSYWVKLRNKIIIYTDVLEVEHQIYAMRKTYGLEDQTIVIQKDLRSFDPQALKMISEVFETYDQSQGRFDQAHPPHTSPEYDYLMYCKSFFICDAIKNQLTSQKILWLDFGYNLGGSKFINPAQFNFELKPQQGLKEEKINFLCLGKEDTRSLSHILIYGTEHFLTGGCIYAGKEAWQRFNLQIQEALKAFISFGIMDDDQKLYIWCLRNHPESFNLLYIDDWFSGLFYFIPDFIRPLIKVKTQSILQKHLPLTMYVPPPHFRNQNPLMQQNVS